MPFYSLPTGGSPVLAGSGAPTGAVGNIGDLYIDQTNKLLYGPKVVGGWPSGPIELSLNITGPTGMGATGSTGPTGGTGPASTVTGPTGAFPFAATGPTAPSLSAAGSIWLDTETGRYFVRYNSAFIEIGVQGERGPTGVAGSFGESQTINAQTAGYTLALSDAGKLVTVNTSTGASLVVPANSSVAFATGVHIDIARLGAGTLSVTGATGVTVNGTPGKNLRAQYSSATLIQYVGDTWLLVGDLST